MKPRIKPRNPMVAPSLFRKAGEHRKPFKALQRREKEAALNEYEGQGRKLRWPGADLIFLA
jgi:hypothetical protein